MAEPKLLGEVRSFDGNAEFLPQLGGTAGMVDMAMGEPDLLHRHLGFGDRLAQAREIAAGIDDHRAHGLRAPQQRAVLLEVGDRNNGGADVFHADLTGALPVLICRRPPPWRWRSASTP